MTIDMLTMTMTESMIETESKYKEIETQTNALMELNLMLASSQNELKESNEKIQTMSTQEKELEKKLDLFETKKKNCDWNNGL
jgi:chromosome segregation ATPase